MRTRRMRTIGGGSERKRRYRKPRLMLWHRAGFSHFLSKVTLLILQPGRRTCRAAINCVDVSGSRKQIFRNDDHPQLPNPELGDSGVRPEADVALWSSGGETS